MEDLNFKKNNILAFGNNVSELNKIMESIFRNNFFDGDTVYFFDQYFDGLEYYPGSDNMGGPVRMRNNNLDGLLTILRSCLIGGRAGITLVVNFDLEVLKNGEYLELLKEFCNSNSEWNLIMGCSNCEDLSGFKFDHIVNV